MPSTATSPSAPTSRSDGACACAADAARPATRVAISARRTGSPPAHRATDLALRIALLHVLALVVHLLAACKRQLDLDVTAPRVQVERYQRQPLLLRRAEERKSTRPNPS